MKSTNLATTCSLSYQKFFVTPSPTSLTLMVNEKETLPVLKVFILLFFNNNVFSNFLHPVNGFVIVVVTFNIY